MKKAIMADVNELRPSKNYAQIYQVENRQLELLIESIKEHKGLLEPIVIEPDNTIVHGVQRWLAYQRLGWDKIPATIFDNLNSIDVDKTLYLISFNRHRDKNIIERLNEIKYLRKVFKKRQGKRTDLEENTDENSRLSSRQLISLHCNISEGNVYKLEKIDEKAPHLLNLISTGELSIHQAYEEVKEKKPKSAKETEPNSEEVSEISNHVCPHCGHKY